MFPKNFVIKKFNKNLNRFAIYDLSGQLIDDANGYRI